MHWVGYDTHFTHHRFVAAKKKKKDWQWLELPYNTSLCLPRRGAIFTAKARRRLEVKRLKMQSVTFKNFQWLLLLYHMKRKRIVTQRSGGQEGVLE